MTTYEILYLRQPLLDLKFLARNLLPFTTVVCLAISRFTVTSLSMCQERKVRKVVLVDIFYLEV